MNNQSFNALGYDQIIEKIASFSVTESGRERVRELTPSINFSQVQAWHQELSEAVEILRISSSVPIHGLEGMAFVLKSFHKGISLKPDHFIVLLSFLETCNKIRKFMKDKEFVAPTVSAYAYGIENIPELEEEIRRCIRNGKIDDYASRDLLKVRKQIAVQEERLKEKLSQILKSSKYRTSMQEAVISQRNGRYVIPIKKEYRSKVKGAVLDVSASGSTFFIEPEEIGAFQEQMEWLYYEEQAEVEKILLMLTGMAEGNESQILMSIDTMVHYDFLFSKAKYCRSINANKVILENHPTLDYKNAIHPLLGLNAVPLSIEIGQQYKALVITGPNTGGKTVSIKTIGLLQLMVQSGLFLPVSEGSKAGFFQKVLVDIGDGQSIEENLSTFSSRIVNIIEILKQANEYSLILLDELGSGTDPAEGMGLATSILEHLNKKGSTLLATTHYSEIKEFADSHLDFMNGSMEFDLNTLKPTYKLRIGRGGESQAFAIALKLGIHPKLIERAHEITYKEKKDYNTLFEGDQKDLLSLEQQMSINKHKKSKKTVLDKSNVPHYSKGDSVYITPNSELGIVYSGPDRNGQYVIYVKGNRLEVNHKRLKLNIPATELYPENYDFSIIFETKENRKIVNQMAKKHIDESIIKPFE